MPNYVLYGGVAVGVSVGVLVYMWQNDTKYFYNGKPGFTYYKWLQWKFMAKYKDVSPSLQDYDNLTKDEKVVVSALSTGRAGGY
jgi:hypothetical protein